MDIDAYLRNPNESCHVQSDVPEQSLHQSTIMGIDEAGRGPVLGPMIYGAAFYAKSFEGNAAKMKFADSKTITESERESIFQKIKEEKNIGWITHIISPATISYSMLKRSKYNLNLISHDSAIELIQQVIDKGIYLSEVYIDTVGPPEKYQSKLKAIFPQLKITVSKKADSLYPVVSAASICAKVTRDEIIKNWKFVENIDKCYIPTYGSGYPSDPQTKDYLRKNMDAIFGYTTFVRFSWSTASSILNEKAAECIWDDDDDESNEKDIKNQSILNFFHKDQDKSTNKISCKPHSFFVERCLKKAPDVLKF